MGLPHLLRRLWRFFHPQWTAMTPKQINDIDRAVSESIAKGSFTTRHRPHPAPPTADQLWATTTTTTTSGAEMVDRSMYHGGDDDGDGDGDGDGNDAVGPMIPAERMWSMSSSHRSTTGRVSSTSSRGHDSGYAEAAAAWPPRPPSSSTTATTWSSSRKYASAYAPQYPHPYMSSSSSQQQGQQPQWGYETTEQPYYHHEGHQSSYYAYEDQQYQQYPRVPYPRASYFPEGGYVRKYVPPAEEDDGIVAGEPINAPF